MNQPHDRERALTATTEKAVSGLFEIGRMWATHGLNIGRAALETSAATLRVTSTLLGEISEQLDDERDARDVETAAESPEDTHPQTADAHE